jgi:mono/diheme cytochrome c family protein
MVIKSTTSFLTRSWQTVLLLVLVMFALPPFSLEGLAPFWYSSPALARGRKSAVPRSIKALYKMRCLKCHGANGKGGPMRDTLPEIPDFTRSNWHQKRSDGQLQASILEGKGKGMPPFEGKIGKKQAKGLVSYIRRFVRGGAKNRPVREDQFEKQFRKLQEQFQRLKKRS